MAMGSAELRPVGSFLENERLRGATIPTKLRDQPAPGRDVRLVPEAIPVECWRESDGSWAAHVPLLGVTAIADSEADLLAETMEVVADFWERLVERYATLSPELRELLLLRQQPLSFQLAR